MVSQPIRVLCVDDNLFVAESLKVGLSLHGGFEWLGSVPSADGLLELVRRMRPHVVLLDIDMPGRDSMEALEELTAAMPQVKTLIVSGYEGNEFLDRALDAGAWGYVPKNDGPDEIIRAICAVHAGQFALGPGMVAKRIEIGSADPVDVAP